MFEKKLSNIRGSFFLVHSKVQMGPILKISTSFVHYNFLPFTFISFRYLMKWILVKFIFFFPVNLALFFGNFRGNPFRKSKKKSHSPTSKKFTLNFLKDLNSILLEFPSSSLLKLRLKKTETLFWEIFNKFRSVIPKVISFPSCYGEAMVDLNQVIESSIYGDSKYKKNLFKLSPKNFFFASFRHLVFKNFSLSDEHILSQVCKNFFESFLPIFSKIFWKSLSGIRMKKEHKVKSTKVKAGPEYSYQKKKPEDFFKKKSFWMKFIRFRQYYSKFPFGFFHSFRHGFGILMEKNFKKLTLLVEYRGQYIEPKFENFIEFFYKTSGLDLFLFRLNVKSLLDATLKGNICRLINHSCNPNCFTRTIFHGKKNHVLIITKQKIFSKEEISYDYCIDFEDSESISIFCLCRDLLCKGDLNY